MFKLGKAVHCAALALACCVAVVAQTPPNLSEYKFESSPMAADAPADDEVECPRDLWCYKYSPFTDTFLVPRVVGLGTDVDATGSLVNPQVFVQNGIVSAHATLTLSSLLFLAPAPPGRPVVADVYVNG